MMPLMSQPYTQAAAITPDNATKITPKVRTTENGLVAVYPDAILVGVAGDVVMLLADGTTTAAITAPAGKILPMTVQRVNATNTTATNLVALWY